MPFSAAYLLRSFESGLSQMGSIGLQSLCELSSVVESPVGVHDGGEPCPTYPMRFKLREAFAGGTSASALAHHADNVEGGPVAYDAEPSVRQSRHALDVEDVNNGNN